MSAPVLNKVSGPEIDRTAAERSKPQLVGPPLGGFVLGSALLVSLLIHGALLGTVLIASPRSNPTEHVESVTVDLVAEAAPEPEKPPEPEKKPEPEKPKPEPEKKPPPRLQIPDFSPMLAAQQAVNSPPKPLPPRSPAANQSQPADPAAANSAPLAAAQEQPQQQEADKPPVIETSPEDAQAAAARISDTMQLQELAALGVFGSAPSDVKNKLSSDVKTKLSAAEIAAFLAELQKCWTIPGDIPANQRPWVAIRVALKRDGSFLAPPEFFQTDGTRFSLTVLKNAMQALTQCAPYRSLPTAKYQEWRLLELKFIGRDGATISDLPRQRVDQTVNRPSRRP